MATEINARNSFSINGAIASHLHISGFQQLADVTEFGHQFRQLKPVSKSFTLWATLLWSDGPFAVKLLGKQLTGMGPGRVCPGCDAVNPPARIECWRCGTVTDVWPTITPNTLPFLITELDSQSLPFDAGMASIKAVSMGEVTSDHLDLLTNGGDLRSIQTGAGFPYGYYVCRWCGDLVNEGRTCQGCQGYETVLSKIVDLRRTCLYCGVDDSRGGAICEKCGGQFHAVTMGQALEV